MTKLTVVPAVPVVSDELVIEWADAAAAFATALRKKVSGDELAVAARDYIRAVRDLIAELEAIFR